MHVRCRFGVIVSVCAMLLSVAAAAERARADDLQLVVKGQPRAQIVVAEDASALIELAVSELRTHIEKMSGATLPVGHAPDDAYPVQVYIGPREEHADALNISNGGLKHGAYRIVTGPDHLVLIGHELDFEPPNMLLNDRGRVVRSTKAWDEAVSEYGEQVWGNPYRSLHRMFNEQTGTWFHDQSGSLNAVHALLRMMGVRWFMPGEIGTVIPSRRTITVPAMDKTVRPDFAVRRFFGPAYFVMSRPDLLWLRRLGLNHGYPVLGRTYQVHGLRPVQRRETMMRLHPEYYALIGNTRWRKDGGHICFSSEGFRQQTIQYARAMFDVFDEPAVDLWPNDGLRMCECRRCVELTPAEAAFRFVDHVARAMVKTHPERMITAGAYAQYPLPPETIDRFTPNVGITVAFPRPGLDQPETWGLKSGQWSYRKLLGGWSQRVTDGKLVGNSNHRGGGVLMTRSIARDLRWRRGRSLGDWNEVGHRSIGPGEQGGRAIGRQTWLLGMHHLNVYANARLLWDAEQDLDALLDDYYRKFFGSAAEQMRDAFDFAEANYIRGKGRPRLSLADRIELTERMRAARDAAGDTVFARRIDYILEEEPSLEELRQRLAEQKEQGKARQNAPLVIGRDASDQADARRYSLVDLNTGETPDIETTFHVTWDRGELVFDIRCEEPDMENLFVTRDVWGGDSVAILMETPYHAYYQIEINPDGEFVDVDREYGEIKMGWGSQAQVETERGSDYWRVVVRLPIVDEEAGKLDPLHNIVGERPSRGAPWYIQVGRVRIRDQEKSAYGLAPTDGGSYHELDKFHRLVIE